MLECPNCGEYLVPIKINTSGGGTLTIDHCTNCGGTWFDRYEINRIAYKDIFKIAAATSIKKNQIIIGKMERLCPRDFNSLTPYHTDISAENLHIERCPACGGIFITEKDLQKFKLSQVTKIDTLKKLAIPFPHLSAVFIPAIFLGLLLFSTFLTVTELQNAQESQIHAKELISSVNNFAIDKNTETIMFTTTSKVKSEITYYTNIFDQKTVPVSIYPTDQHTIILKNLSADTLYTYRLILTEIDGSRVKSKEYTFRSNK